MTYRRAVQMHALLYDGSSSNGGPAGLKADLTPDLLNTFWQRSLNLSGQAAFSITRSNPKASLIVPQVDHLELWRETSSGATRVFQGKISGTNQAQGDMIVRVIDYYGYLQRSRTGYRVFYKSKKVGSEIVGPEWALAKVTDHSPLAFVATGTIEDPLGLDGITPITTNDKFGVALFDRLFLFYSLAEMSMANTSNNVVVEITTAATPTFNFWKNRQVQRPQNVFCFPGNMRAFSYVPGWEELINDMASVVKKDTGGGQIDYSVEDTASVNTYRRLQSAMAIQTLMGLDDSATEADQMKAAVQRLLNAATRLPKMFVALPRQNEIEPLVGHDLGDLFYSFILKEGTTQTDEVAAWLRLISAAASWRPDTGEQVTLYLRGQDT